MAEPQRYRRWGWTAGNLSALIVIVAALAGLLGYRLWTRRARLNEQFAVVGATLEPAAERVDINSAEWPELVRLPNIGETRARNIVRYRRRYLQRNPGGVAFTGPEDLTAVEDIGEEIAARIARYLIFPAPQTQPTTDAR